MTKSSWVLPNPENGSFWPLLGRRVHKGNGWEGVEELGSVILAMYTTLPDLVPDQN